MLHKRRKIYWNRYPGNSANDIVIYRGGTWPVWMPRWLRDRVVEEGRSEPRTMRPEKS